MKKYVFFSSYIGGMGGGQMYVRNKMLWLRKRGWKTDIFSCPVDQILISELNEFRDNCFLPTFPVFFYSQKQKKKVFKRLKERIVDDNYEEIIIESNSIGLSLWAESFSKLIGAKHFAYPLSEKNNITQRGVRQYLVFKFQRRELAGITDTSLIQLFTPFYSISRGGALWLPAYCNNVEANIDNPLLSKIDKNKYDYVVGCLSRLNKDFVFPAIKDLCRYASLNKYKKFLLLLMGDSANDESIINSIKEYVKRSESNVDLIMTGYLYPVPTKLLELCDVLFASAGSALVCMRSGVPTISFDANDLQPIGVLGRTTQNCLYRGENEPAVSFVELLRKILEEKRFCKEASTYIDGLPDFTEHINFIRNSVSEKQYYDTDRIKIETKSEKYRSIGIRLWGDFFYGKILSVKKEINRLFKQEH